MPESPRRGEHRSRSVRCICSGVSVREMTRVSFLLGDLEAARGREAKGEVDLRSLLRHQGRSDPPDWQQQRPQRQRQEQRPRRDPRDQLHRQQPRTFVVILESPPRLYFIGLVYLPLRRTLARATASWWPFSAPWGSGPPRTRSARRQSTLRPPRPKI